MNASTIKAMIRDPAVFRENLVVDVNGKQKLFGSVLDDWQRADFKATDDGWRLAAGSDQGRTDSAGLPRTLTGPFQRLQTWW